MNTPKTLAVAAFVLLIVAFTLVGAPTGRAYQPSQPTQFGSSAAIFEKGKPYLLLFEEGLLRRWFLCTVQDAKDNWVKCDGGRIDENNKPVEPFVGMWFNTNYVLRVSTK